jgi:uncharacterized protein (DUF488 family)
MSAPRPRIGRKAAVASGASVRVFTVGYEGRDIESFVTLLSDHRVETLVDVRLTPISRKPGFSKTALSAALEDAGITYVHERRLGNPKDNRPAYRAGEKLAQRRYLRHITDGGAEAVAWLAETVAHSVTALLCVERESTSCHRSAIAEHLGLPTVSL